MGSFGAWALAVSQPHMFAAMVSICGGFIGAKVPMETSRAQMLRLSDIDRDEGMEGLEKHWKRWNALKKCKKYQLGYSMV